MMMIQLMDFVQMMVKLALWFGLPMGIAGLIALKFAK